MWVALYIFFQQVSKQQSARDIAESTGYTADVPISVTDRKFELVTYHHDRFFKLNGRGHFYSIHWKYSKLDKRLHSALLLLLFACNYLWRKWMILWNLGERTVCKTCNSPFFHLFVKEKTAFNLKKQSRYQWFRIFSELKLALHIAFKDILVQNQAYFWHSWICSLLSE